MRHHHRWGRVPRGRTLPYGADQLVQHRVLHGLVVGAVVVLAARRGESEHGGTGRGAQELAAGNCADVRLHQRPRRLRAVPALG